MFIEVIELIEVDMEARTEMGGRDPKVVNITEVFANKESVKQNEFYLAFQTGFETTAMFTVWKHEYNDERVVKHRDKYYTVVRTYENGDYIYLTCTKRSGLFEEAVR